MRNTLKALTEVGGATNGGGGGGVTTLPANTNLLYHWTAASDAVFEDASKTDPAENGDTIIKIEPQKGSLDLEIESDDANRAALWVSSHADFNDKPALEFRRSAGSFSHSGYNPDNTSFADTDGPITIGIIAKAPTTLRAGSTGMVLHGVENLGGGLRIRMMDDGSFDMQFGSTMNPWRSTATGIVSAGETFWLLAQVDGDAPDATIHLYINDPDTDLLSGADSQSGTDQMQGAKIGSSDNYQNGWNGETSGAEDFPGYIADYAIWDKSLSSEDRGNYDSYSNTVYGV